MLIKNVKILNENNCFEDGQICVKDGFFAALSDKDDIFLDGEGSYIIPGLIDIHLHGCMSRDVSDGNEEALETICRYEAENGITTIVPTTMTIAVDDLIKVLETIADYVEKSRSVYADFLNNDISDKRIIGARIAGINLEGPFISKEKKGSHNEDNIIKCDMSIFEKLLAASKGLIKIVDVAPETDGAYDFIEKIKDNVIVSIAHTEADYNQAAKAFKKGADHVTHLYNGMKDCMHRSPGVVGAAADNDKVFVELICDGIHVHPAVIRASFKIFGQDRIIVISDSIRGAGLLDGEYTLGGQRFCVKNGKAQMPDGTIAGSTSNLMEAVRFLVKEVGIPLGIAVKCASINPAKRLGIYDEVGSISPGKRADFVLLDEELNVKAVYMSGVQIR